MAMYPILPLPRLHSFQALTPKFAGIPKLRALNSTYFRTFHLGRTLALLDLRQQPHRHLLGYFSDLYAAYLNTEHLPDRK